MNGSSILSASPTQGRLGRVFLARRTMHYMGGGTDITITPERWLGPENDLNHVEIREDGYPAVILHFTSLAFNIEGLGRLLFRVYCPDCREKLSSRWIRRRAFKHDLYQLKVDAAAGEHPCLTNLY